MCNHVINLFSVMMDDMISRHSQCYAAGHAYLETRSAADFILYQDIYCALPSVYLPFFPFGCCFSEFLILFSINFIFVQLLQLYNRML